MVIAIKGNRRVVLKNPIDATSWSAEETLRNVSILLDENGNVVAIPTFSINPQNSPIPAGGSIGNVGLIDGGGTGTVADVTNISGWGKSLRGQVVTVLQNVGTGSFDYAEEATGFASGNATAGTSTQLLPAVSGKKYKIFGIYLQAISSGSTGTSCSVNEASSGQVFIEISIPSITAGFGIAQYVPFGNNGILQTTANNAIQVTAGTVEVANATIFYGAAR